MIRFLRFVVIKDFIKRFLKPVKKKAQSSEELISGKTIEDAASKPGERGSIAEVDLAKAVKTTEVTSVEAGETKVEAIIETCETRQQTLPKQVLICIGEYPAKILLKDRLHILKDEVRPIFIDRSSEEIMKWSKDSLNEEKVVGLDANVDKQFWYQVSPYLTENQVFFDRVRNRLEGSEFSVLTVSSLWEGVGGALPPALISKLKEWNMNEVTIAISPSRLQASSAHFNALYSIGRCLSEDSAVLVLLNRDQLNRYVGVDRNGSVIKGSLVLENIIQMMMAKKAHVNDFSEISRSFGVKAFTILAAMGASLKVYGSLENILSSTTSRPLEIFDLSGASLVYVLVRLPNLFKEKLTRDKIELIISDWWKEKAVLKSVIVAEPLYAEDVTDRIDLLMFVGGFELASALATMKKKAEIVRIQATKKGLVKEEEWKEILKNLV